MEGRAEFLLYLLSMRFGPTPRGISDRIHAADGAQVVTWAQRLLTASTLDEVFSETA
ncbi:hypothetical protein IU449_13875 [Nocardia higoensis]|uniref:DUF4351 domain-containing protein n=1 Tax=Nocardia higoensis TaxID=228599 RepID=A0ABS0DAY1_9NOCA|nr:hypothetical protein [Nocardia higoensis]MBF6355620.1 hypothetical protein [Nocardia higoensis]